MATIRYVPEQFSDLVFAGESNQSTLLECLSEFSHEHQEIRKPLLGKRVSIYINGNLIPPDDWMNYKIDAQDVIEITHVLGDSGGIIQTFLGAVIIGAGLYTGNPTLTLLGVSLFTGGLLQMFFSPDEPQDPRQSTPTYSWDGPTTLFSSDMPISAIYGKNLIGGQAINFRIWSTRKLNYLDLLLALGEGEIEGIMNEANTALVSSPPSTFASTQTDAYIKLNDIFESDHEEVYWAFRSGTNSQTSIPSFRDTNTTYTWNIKVPTANYSAEYWSPTYTTNGEINEFTVEFECPKLYSINNQGETKKMNVWLKLKYRKSGDPTWTLWEEGDGPYGWLELKANTQSPINTHITVSNLPQGVYEIQVRRQYDHSEDPKRVNDCWAKLVTETLYKDLRYPNTALLAIRAKATDALSGSFPNINILVKGLKVRVPAIFYASATNIVDNPSFEIAGGGGADIWDDWTETAGDGAIADEGSLVYSGSHAAKLTGGASNNTYIYQNNTTDYEELTAYKLTFYTRGDGSNAGKYSIYDLTNGKFIVQFASTGVTGTSYTAVTYTFITPKGCTGLQVQFNSPPANGGVAYFDLVRIQEAEAFESLYWDNDTTQWKRISDDEVCTWDSTTYVVQYTSNPAYCCRDFLTNTRYGVGDFIETGDLDDTTINNCAKKQWQLINSEHRNELHLVIEGPSDPYSVLKSIARAGRMLIFWSSGYIKFKYEEDEDPVQLFTMGNIKENSFQISYSPYSEIPNIIEAQFADEDEDYKMSMREVVDEASWALSKPKRRHTVSFKGITNENQLLRETKFLLNSSLIKTKMVTFKAPMDAVHCEPGDIVNVSHDVPQWGWSGRVYSGTSTSVTVDQNISNTVIAAVTTYDIRVIHNDDTIETFDLSYFDVIGDNLLTNSSFETFTGTADDATTDTFNSWTNYNADDPNGNSILAVTTAQLGSYAVKITNGNDPDATIVSYTDVVCGKPCSLAFYTRGDGSVGGRFYVYDNTNSVPIISETSTGITGTSYTIYRCNFVIPNNCTQLAIRFFAPSSSGAVYYDNIVLKYINPKKVFINGTFSTTPSEDEKYIIGKTTSSIVPYRIQSVRIDSEEFLSLQAVIHSAAIYSDSGIVSSTREQSELPNPNEPADDVTNLTLVEMFNKPGFIISFVPPNDYTWEYAAIYLSVDNDQFWKIPGGQATGSDFQYTNVVPGITYYVRVYSVNKNGIRSTSYVTDNIRISGNNLQLPPAPSKLEIFNQGNNVRFSGRDCKIQWSKVVPYVGAGSSFPEEPIGDSAIDWSIIKDFKIEVWSGSSRVREEYTTDTWYLYTFEKNKEDNISPLGTVIFKVYQRNYFNKISEQPATITVYSDTPPPPREITTISEEDGVTFNWSEVNISDFSHYEYRTKVDSGSWSSWITEYTNSTTRWLTIAELQEQGTGQSTIYIEVRSVDVFNTKSITKSSNTTCNNMREYLVVSPTAGKGQYTTIASAVAALPSDGGTIVLKEGSYTLPVGGLSLPNKDIVIRGVGIDTVKVYNVASYNGFVLPNLAKKFSFKDFTFESNNNDTYSYMIYVYGSGVGGVASAYEKNTAKLVVDSVNFNLKDNGTAGGTGDLGINASYGSGSYNILNITASGGRSPIRLYGVDNIYVTGNYVKYSKYHGIFAYSYSKGPSIITDNRVDNFTTYGIYSFCVQTATCPGGIVANNYISFNPTASYIEVITIPIFGGGKRVQVNNNHIIVENANVTPTTDTVDNIRGIVLGGGSIRGQCNNNNIFINVDHKQRIYGIIGANASHLSTNNNTIHIINASTQNPTFGIDISGDYGTYNNNNITLSDQTQDDGIILQATAQYNYGVGNLCKNVENAVYDIGSNNEVTATTV